MIDGDFYEIEFAIENEGSAPYVATHQTCAEHPLLAVKQVRDFVKKYNSRWATFKEPRFAVIKTRKLEEDDPKQPLLVLIGGKTEADPLLLPPNLRYPDGSLVVIRLPGQSRQVCHIVHWLPTGNFKGWIWSRAHKDWLGPYFFWPAEIVGTADAIAKGKLKLAVDAARKKSPPRD